MTTSDVRERIAEHDRDGVGICKRCGDGLSGLAVVDGEAPCPGGIRDA